MQCNVNGAGFEVHSRTIDVVQPGSQERNRKSSPLAPVLSDEVQLASCLGNSCGTNSD